MDAQDLELVGIAPLLCDDVWASAGASLRLHIGGGAAALARVLELGRARIKGSKDNTA